uniref:Uncharacterized protein n=1 Tax=Rhizophora mucronata TaxID=61149 RepID=A0A2P2P7F2_RHIMU
MYKRKSVSNHRVLSTLHASDRGDGIDTSTLRLSYLSPCAILLVIRSMESHWFPV